MRIVCADQHEVVDCASALLAGSNWDGSRSHFRLHMDAYARSTVRPCPLVVIEAITTWNIEK